MNTAADRHYETVFPDFTLTASKAKFVHNIAVINSICVPNHHWTFASGETEPIEGQPCDCGIMIYKKIICPNCGDPFLICFKK
jgi:hypothetical protein